MVVDLPGRFILENSYMIKGFMKNIYNCRGRINHNGDISIAKKLIDVAFIWADAIKFQKRNIDKVYSKKFLILHAKALGVILKRSKRRSRVGKRI